MHDCIVKSVRHETIHTSRRLNALGGPDIGLSQIKSRRLALTARRCCIISPKGDTMASNHLVHLSVVGTEPCMAHAFPASCSHLIAETSWAFVKFRFPLHSTKTRFTTNHKSTRKDSMTNRTTTLNRKVSYGIECIHQHTIFFNKYVYCSCSVTCNQLGRKEGSLAATDRSSPSELKCPLITCGRKQIHFPTH